MPEPVTLDTAVEHICQADDPAQELYQVGNDFEYGIGGALEQGTVLRSPNQVKGQANCYELALFNYTVADQAGLDPTFYEVMTQSPRMVHGFITVQDDDDEIMIDPYRGTFGQMETVSDTRITVGDGTTQDISGITERTGSELQQRLEEYRTRPETVLTDGQRITTHDASGVYEGIIYDEARDSVRHVVNRTPVDSVGFLNHQVVVEQPVDGDDQCILFCDTTQDIRRGFDEGDVIARRYDSGDIAVDLHALSEEVERNIAAATQYDALATGEERIYAKEDLRAYYEQFQRDHEQFMWGATPFNNHIWDWLSDLISMDGDTLWNTIDWLKFVDDHAPFEDAVTDTDVRTYLDRHEQLYTDYITDTPNYTRHASTIIADQRDDTDSESTSTITDDRVGTRSRSELAAAGFVDPEIRQDAGFIDWDSLTQEPLDYHEPFGDAETRWAFDPDTFTLTCTEGLGGSDLFPYRSNVEVRYDVDWDGTIGDVTVTMTAQPKLATTTYILFETTVDALDDLDRADVQDGWQYRIEASAENSSAHPPLTPDDVNTLADQQDRRTERNRYQPKDIVDHQYRKIGLFASASEQGAAVFTREQLLADLTTARNEFTQLADAAYPTLEERQRVEDSLPVINKLGEPIDFEEYAAILQKHEDLGAAATDAADMIERIDDDDYALIEQNVVRAMLRNDRDGLLQTQVMDLPREERENALTWGYYDMVSALQDRTTARNTFHRLIQDGLEHIAPGETEIHQYAADNNLDHVKHLISDSTPQDHIYNELDTLQTELNDLPWQMKTGIAQHLDDSVYNRVRNAFTTLTNDSAVLDGTDLQPVDI